MLLKSNIPPTEPKPKIKIKANPSRAEGMVVKTSSMRAALPASP